MYKPKNNSVPLREVYQILDANVNRAREGLRVVEEVFRFVLKNPAMTRKLKAMRREVEVIVAGSDIAAPLLLEVRDSKRDPGRYVHSVGEMSRTSLQDILNANLHRVAEALRVLEEFSKLLDSKAAKKFKDMRFRFYDLEKVAHEEI